MLNAWQCDGSVLIMGMTLIDSWMKWHDIQCKAEREIKIFQSWCIYWIRMRTSSYWQSVHIGVLSEPCKRFDMHRYIHLLHFYRCQNVTQCMVSSDFNDTRFPHKIHEYAHRFNTLEHRLDFSLRRSLPLGLFSIQT